MEYSLYKLNGKYNWNEDHTVILICDKFGYGTVLYCNGEFKNYSCDFSNGWSMENFHKIDSITLKDSKKSQVKFRRNKHNDILVTCSGKSKIMIGEKYHGEVNEIDLSFWSDPIKEITFRSKK